MNKIAADILAAHARQLAVAAEIIAADIKRACMLAEVDDVEIRKSISLVIDVGAVKKPDILRAGKNVWSKSVLREAK